MKKFYCCDYCDELFETEEACKKHEETCTDKADFEECRALDKDSIVRQLKDLLEEVEIFDEAYNANILKELYDEVHSLDEEFESCDHTNCNCNRLADNGTRDNGVFDFDFDGLNKEVESTFEKTKKNFEDTIKDYAKNKTGKACTFYLNGKKLSREDFLKEIDTILDKDVKSTAKSAAKTAVKKTDDFLTSILDKLEID